MKAERPSYEKHGEAQTQRPYNRQAKEDTILIEASFEPTNEGDLWKKDGIFYGREAALQNAFQKLRGKGAKRE